MHREHKLTAKDGFVRGPQQGTALARRSLLGVAGLGLLALVTLVQFRDNGVFALFHLQRQETALRQEVAGLQQQKDELNRRLAALADEDDEALEKLAREKYNMQKPGEKVLLVLMPPAE